VHAIELGSKLHIALDISLDLTSASMSLVGSTFGDLGNSMGLLPLVAFLVDSASCLDSIVVYTTQIFYLNNFALIIKLKELRTTFIFFIAE
jgi:hypothetical protein